MSELPDRVRRAFRDRSSFEQVDDARFELTSTPFTGLVDASATDGGRIRFDVTARVPMLSAVTEDDVADVVEAGWYETFELRVRDIAGVTRAEHDFEMDIRRAGDEIVVETGFEDNNERRGVEDAEAVVNYVEGTFVQGIIPGYDYTEPVTGILKQASQAAGGDTDGLSS
ncbi:DUF5813 family protein [Haloferacaceae archaeon DSL9]